MRADPLDDLMAMRASAIDSGLASAISRISSTKASSLIRACPASLARSASARGRRGSRHQLVQFELGWRRRLSHPSCRQIAVFIDSSVVSSSVSVARGTQDRSPVRYSPEFLQEAVRDLLRPSGPPPGPVRRSCDAPSQRLSQRPRSTRAAASAVRRMTRAASRLPRLRSRPCKSLSRAPGGRCRAFRRQDEFGRILRQAVDVDLNRQRALRETRLRDVRECRISGGGRGPRRADPSGTTGTPRQKRCGSRISRSGEKLLEWPL